VEVVVEVQLKLVYKLQPSPFYYSRCWWYWCTNFNFRYSNYHMLVEVEVRVIQDLLATGGTGGTGGGGDGGMVRCCKSMVTAGTANTGGGGGGWCIA
jgi:hypothetical protein